MEQFFIDLWFNKDFDILFWQNIYDGSHDQPKNTKIWILHEYTM